MKPVLIKHRAGWFCGVRHTRRWRDKDWPVISGVVESTPAAAFKSWEMFKHEIPASRSPFSEAGR